MYYWPNNFAGVSMAQFSTARVEDVIPQRKQRQPSQRAESSDNIKMHCAPRWSIETRPWW